MISCQETNLVLLTELIFYFFFVYCYTDKQIPGEELECSLQKGISKAKKVQFISFTSVLCLLTTKHPSTVAKSLCQCYLFIDQAPKIPKSRNAEGVLSTDVSHHSNFAVSESISFPSALLTFLLTVSHGR